MRQTCSEGECGGPAFGRGLCSAHYQRARYHGTLPTEPPNRSCEHCGEVFSARKWNAQYCSRACNDAARYQRVEAKPRRHSACDWCQGSLEHVRCDARFCSVLCGQAWRNDQESQRRTTERTGRECRGCTEIIPADRNSKALYCSESCKIKSRRHEAYNLTKQELDLLLEQHAVCAICATTSWGKKGPQVDHDHATSAVRGILCSNCNQGLGRFADDPVRLRAAADYLERVTV